MKPSSGIWILLAGLFWTLSGEMILANDSRNSPEIKLSAGFPVFFDADTHYAFGGATSVPLSSRIGVGVELMYMYESPRDQDVTLVPTVHFNLRDPIESVVPYLVGGVGIIGSRRPGAGSSHQFRWQYGYSLGGGIGVKVFLSNRCFLSPEIRLGYQPFLQITGSFGFHW